MQLEDTRTITRLEHAPFKWHFTGRFVSGSSPKDRRFGLFGQNGEHLGDLAFREYRPAIRSVLETPWGDITLTQEGGFIRNGRRGRIDVSVEGRLIASLEPHALKWIFRFPDGTMMAFRLRTGYHWLEYQDDLGGVSVSQGRPLDGRPRWSIVKSGILPARERDVFASLIGLTCLDELDYEELKGADGL